MAKVSKHFRLDLEVIEMMETLIPFLSAEKNLKLNNTTLIEILVSERYQKLLKDSDKGS